MHVLFIGNSHTYYNSMPAIFADLYEATGEKMRVTMLAEGGKTLAYHAKTPNAAFNIRYGKYDIVILQDLVTGFDEALTNEYKTQLVRERKDAMFAEKFDAFAGTLEIYIKEAE